MIKKSKKMLLCMFAVFMTAFLLPFTVRAAITAGSGDGTEGNPRVLTVGYGDDTFSYTGKMGGDYTYYFYLKVTFTDPAKVTMSNEGGIVTYKKEASGRYEQGISYDGIHVKKNETIFISLTRGYASGGQGTLKITSKAIDTSGEDSQGRSQAYCPKNVSGMHSFYYGAPCKYCGFACTHPKNERDYGNYGYKHENGYHCPYFSCNACGNKSCLDPADKKKCMFDRYDQSSYDANNKVHQAHCAICKNYTTQKVV